MNVAFPYTNETLDAIIAGLDVKQGDNILAVVGSGDQAFAMIAEGAKVVAIDTSQIQIDYAKKRLECLKQGITEGFFGCKDKIKELEKLGGEYAESEKKYAEQSDMYFKSERRMEKVLANMHNLSIIERSILDKKLPLSCFNKVYLSNVIEGHIRSFLEEFGCKNLFNMHQGHVRTLNLLGSRVNPGCLIYVTDSNRIVSDKAIIEYGYGDRLGEREVLDLEKDEELSAKAAGLEKSGLRWRPLVLRRAE